MKKRNWSIYLICFFVLGISASCSPNITEVNRGGTSEERNLTPAIDVPTITTSKDRTLTPAIDEPTVSPPKSPAGKVIFMNDGIRLLDLDDREIHILYPEGEKLIIDFDTLPDAKGIIFLSDQHNQHGIMDLYYGDILGSEPVRLTSNDDPDFGIDVSPDGEELVFVRQYENEDQSVLFDLFVLDIRTKEEKQITWGEFPKQSPKWSPNGEYILYGQSNQNSTRDDLILFQIGENQGEVLVKGIYLMYMTAEWSPDGKWIVGAGGMDNGNLEIILVDVFENEYEFITKQNDSCRYPS